MLALDDDTSEFHRRFARDPLLGPTVQRLRGMRTRRKATVTHAAIRAVCGSAHPGESRRSQIERAIIRGVRRGSADPRGARSASLPRDSPRAGSPRAAPRR